MSSGPWLKKGRGKDVRDKADLMSRRRGLAVIHAVVSEPHVIAGITKAMLMGGNARVARRREPSDVV